MVAAVGLIVNAAGAWVLHGSVRHSINVEGAFRHLMAHVLMAAGMIISALLIMAFGWEFIDPLLSVFIGVLILFSAWTLLRASVPRADGRGSRNTSTCTISATT